MKVVTTLADANSALKEYKGATAQICMYSMSLKRLAIRLLLPGSYEALYIIGIGCERISGFFNWENTEMSIEIVTGLEQNESTTKIIDRNASFELLTSGGFSILTGHLKEFGNSFDEFINNDSTIDKV